MNIREQMDKWILEKVSEEAIKEIIMEFLAKNPNPEDSQIHELADKYGIDSHKFESYVYSLLGSFLGYGRAVEDGFTEDDADPEQLKMGIEIEMEHTNEKLIAKRITLDHLAEIPDYYTRLIKMEKDVEE